MFQLNSDPYSQLISSDGEHAGWGVDLIPSGLHFLIQSFRMSDQLILFENQSFLGAFRVLTEVTQDNVVLTNWHNVNIYFVPLENGC